MPGARRLYILGLVAPGGAVPAGRGAFPEGITVSW
jgi:hypothetical protein